MSPAPTPQDVADVCRSVFGRLPADVRAKRDATFFADYDDRRLIVKFAREADRATPLVEAWVYQQCRARGLAVPEVFAALDDPECMVVERFNGVDLWSETARARDNRDMWGRAGEELRAMHEIAVEGFGPLRWRSGVEAPAGVSDLWCPFARSAQDEWLPYLGRKGVFPDSTVAALLRRYEEAEPLINAVATARLLHGDLEGGHIFMGDDGVYLGIIDFDQAQAGDPRWDLARIPMWDGGDALEALLTGYGADAVTEADRELLLPIYLLSFTLHHVVQAHDASRDDLVKMMNRASGYERLL